MTDARGVTVRRVDGTAVHVSGRGPAVVLLHANGGSHHDFDAVVGTISRHATVFAVDWPGHGDSASAPAPTACGFADLLPGVLDHLGAGPYTLIGNSVGGFAALRTAARRPDLVDRLVLVDPGGFTPRSPLALGVGSRPDRRWPSGCAVSSDRAGSRRSRCGSFLACTSGGGRPRWRRSGRRSTRGRAIRTACEPSPPCGGASPTVGTTPVSMRPR
jgi:pimeloyl-ACP methyl ester carboxylesterase